MTSLNDYFLAGRKALERWRPSLPSRPAGAGAGGAFRPPEDQPWPPSLESLLAQADDLPPYALTLGACEDGLPFLLDLDYPAPGALLVCGDAGCGKTSLLHALAASAIAQNEPGQVQISILAHEPESYLDLAAAEHCQEIFAVDDPVIADLLAELGQMVETRRRSRPTDPAIVLFIDGLAECLRSLDQEGFERLYRLARHGPRARIWTIASLDMRQLQALEPRFLAAFRTQLLGRIRNRHSALALGLPSTPPDTRDLEDGLFLMPYGPSGSGEWLRLWACAPDAAPLAAPKAENSTSEFQEDER